MAAESRKLILGIRAYDAKTRADWADHVVASCALPVQEG